MRTVEHAPAVLTSLRVLVVDDSAYNRRTISAMLESLDGVCVVARACNGKEALQLAMEHRPDAITLDLEMPEMDGFAFLRILMQRQPTPVLIVSGYAQHETVFRALELGAIDFIAKPRRAIGPDIREIERELAEKIAIIRRLHAVRLQEGNQVLGEHASVRKTHEKARQKESETMENPAQVVVAIGASTGGPPAIQRLLDQLPDDFQAAIVIAQHMPARFTKAFAMRMDRLLRSKVVEARDDQELMAGVIYVIPGACNMDILEGSKGHFRFKTFVAEGPLDVPKLAPSVDHLFTTVSKSYGERCCAVVLTGMGSDGTVGAKTLREGGGRIFCEDPRSAVMPGMPLSVLESGVVDLVSNLDRLHDVLFSFVHEKLKKIEAEK